MSPEIALVSEVVQAIDRDEALEITDVRDMLIGVIGRLGDNPVRPARWADLLREGAFMEAAR